MPDILEWLSPTGEYEDFTGFCPLPPTEEKILLIGMVSNQITVGLTGKDIASCKSQSELLALANSKIESARARIKE